MRNETIRGLIERYADYLTPEEAAELLGISIAAVYRRLQAGDLAGFQIRRQWRIPRQEIEALLGRPIV
ncbi:MAG TPA: helix-turn-helix domain-containing protein [Chloroflexota bacterium]|jgi:excisionase family DNA binding protein|nr:helix-turn-helix domain-containing protein [Chloroflexota bacterium]